MANGLQPLRRPDDRLRPLNYPSLDSQPLRPLRQRHAGPSVLEQPPSPTMGYLPGRQSVGEAVRDYPYQSFESLLDEAKIPASEPVPLEQPEVAPQSLLDSMLDAARNLLDYMPSIISEAGASSSIPTEDQDFFNNYINNYYAGKEVNKATSAENNAKDKLSKLRGGSLSIPPIAQQAIDTAVDIFGTDYGKDGKARKKRYGEDRLRADLERIGAIESGYVHLKNLRGGSDSGYWQVQPSTAKDSLENASEHFGEEFDKQFAPEGWSHDELLQMTEDDIQDLMRVKKKENQALAASFAAVKILQTFDY